MNLAEELLSSGCFDSNEYFEKYVSLVEENIGKDRIPGVTQSHHIKPRNYYNHFHLEVDNTASNLVNLKHTDHVLAHYYLTKCAKEEWFKNANIVAVKFMLDSSTLPYEDICGLIETAGIDITNLATCGIPKSNECKEKHRLKIWCTDGKNEIQLEQGDEIPAGYYKGRCRDIIEAWARNNRGKHAWNYGLPMRESTKEKLRVPKSEEHKRKLSQNKIEFYQNHPGFRNSGNWVTGHEPHNKNKISITDGVKNKYISEDTLDEWILKGWYRGNTQHHNRGHK